jgi:pimeloyl-ACP methyl ester carboxylesterase
MPEHNIGTRAVADTDREVQARESNERIIHTNGVDLCVETFGDPACPAMLLIMGAAASMLGWEDEFCRRLAAGSRFVIRYDNRDTGRSVSYEPGAPQYTMRDLVADALGLLDAFGLARAHFVGMSAGGVISQLVAVDHPKQVASLTLISTSPGGPDLPGPSDEFLAFVTAAAMRDWSDRTAVVNYIVEFERACAGSSRPFDEPARHHLAGRVFDRTANIASAMQNHFLLEAGDPLRERLGEIRAPTLVLHGTEDPVFPHAHARALANAIPRAQLLMLEQTGHELPRSVWDLVVPAILRHSSGR